MTPMGLPIQQVFPARAGVILAAVKAAVEKNCLSRTSGGDPTASVNYLKVEKSFPHERG